MKAVIFDFDGTLTEKKGNLWKRIWKELGWDTGPDSYYVSLFKRFMSGNITHRQWCELTLEAFQEKGFTKPWKNGFANEYAVAGSPTRLNGSKSNILGWSSRPWSTERRGYSPPFLQ